MLESVKKQSSPFLNCGAVILAGGRSRRLLGRDKAALTLSGRSFLEILSRELGGFPERYWSVDRRGRYNQEAFSEAVPEFQEVADAPPGCGPLGGLAAALRVCRSAALLAVSVDLPLFRKELGEYLAAFWDGTVDAVVAVDREGRRHHLCAIYGKSALPVFGEQLAAGNYRLSDALDRLRLRAAPLRHSVFPDTILSNINTPEEYEEVCKTETAWCAETINGPAVPQIIAVCGAKKSGKTRLLVGVIPHLVAIGLRVGVIKHDGHDFTPDVPGSDSFRLTAAGAAVTAVYSPERFAVNAELENTTPERLLPLFHGVDVILLEGGKASPYPKIEVIRKANRNAPVSTGGTLLAFASDEPGLCGGVPTYALDDYAGVAELITKTAGKAPPTGR